jgi:hypothetical protein
MTGEEASLRSPMASPRCRSAPPDHKTVGTATAGPIPAAWALPPAAVFDAEVQERAMAEIVPHDAALAKEGCPIRACSTSAHDHGRRSRVSTQSLRRSGVPGHPAAPRSGPSRSAAVARTRPRVATCGASIGCVVAPAAIWARTTPVCDHRVEEAACRVTVFHAGRHAATVLVTAEAACRRSGARRDIRARSPEPTRP